MPWVRFVQAFDYRINRHCIRHYKAGKAYLVSQATAAKAIDEGKAVATERPKETT